MRPLVYQARAQQYRHDQGVSRSEVNAPTERPREHPSTQRSDPGDHHCLGGAPGRDHQCPTTGRAMAISARERCRAYRAGGRAATMEGPRQSGEVDRVLARIEQTAINLRCSAPGIRAHGVPGVASVVIELTLLWQILAMDSRSWIVGHGFSKSIFL